MEKMERHPYRWLGLLGLIVFLAGNMYLAITDTAESNYALTAKEMVLAHNWLSPQIYGHYWYDKPIFFYWELMLSYSLFGFTEFASRLPSALFGTLGVLFTYWFTQRIYDKKVGLMAALILMTSVECWIISKAVVTDATLFLFMSGSIAFFYLGYHENRRWYYLCYVAAAFAVLTKGPIGLLLPGLGATVFLILKHDVKEFLKVHLFSGFVLCIVICMSWYGWMYAVHGSDFVLNFLGSITTYGPPFQNMHRKTCGIFTSSSFLWDLCHGASPGPFYYGRNTKRIPGRGTNRMMPFFFSVVTP